MKTIAILIFILFTAVSAQAQTAINNTTEMTQVITTENTEVLLENATEVARLYKYKNSRIKKALSFTTKRNKTKMA